MKKIFSVISCVMLAFSLTACGSAGNNSQSSTSQTNASVSDITGNSTSTNNNDTLNSSDNSENSSDNSENSGSNSNEPSTSESSSILVAYFSLANEQYEVGVIEKGNTQIIAEIIAEKTGADAFSITATTVYPTTYNGLLDISRKEESAPPKLAATVTNMADYDTVFIGYPIWWGDLPTIVKVFLESHDFSGKTVIPFCTHAGSGLSGTQKSVESLCAGAKVKNGLAVRGATAQNDRSAAESAVNNWLTEIGINGR